MSCRRAFDIDLAGFLDEPRAEPFDAFRAHYPRCVPCAAEVRAWTELHEQLGTARHPNPEALAGYAELPAAERVAIDRHTAQCPACREELRLLDVFDASALAQPSVAVPEPRERNGWMQALARILWHPAFAYGMAVLVVVPLLWRTQAPGRFADVAPLARVVELEELEQGRSDSGRAKLAQASPSRRLTAATVAPQRDAKGDAGEESVAASTTSVPVPAVEIAEASAALPANEFEEPKAPTAPRSEFVALRSAPQRVEAAVLAQPQLAAAEQRKSAEPVFEAAGADALGLRAAAGRRVAESGSAGAAFADSEPAHALPNPLAAIVLAAAPEQVSVRLPVLAGVRRSVEVVVSDAAGVRALRQRAEAAPERGEVAIELPRAWLSPGQSRVELRDGAAPVRVFSLTVVLR